MLLAGASIIRMKCVKKTHIGLDKGPLCARFCGLFLLASLLTACGGGGGGGGGNGSNQIAPVAVSSALSIDEDTSTSNTLNASDAEGDTLTYQIIDNASKGAAIITDPATGAYTYTPDPDLNGMDSFTFKANDGTDDSNTATVTVTINPASDLPVANTSDLSTDEDTPASGTLKASNPDGDSLSYQIIDNASKGAVTITAAATGAYTYTPDLNENGADSFTFKVSNSFGDSNTATVSVTINPVNDLPVATGDCSTTPQAQTLTATLKATDLETPAMLMYRLGADGSEGTGPIMTAKGGVVTITDATTGKFTYKPASNGARGTDSFSFQVTDLLGGSDSATETVIIDKKIMPLGDSITAGVNSIGPVIEKFRVGYRKRLYDSLRGSGFGFDFVGTLTDGWGVSSFDFNHEGHRSWSAIQIAFGVSGFPSDGVRAWLNANPADIVLLHAGTNQLDPNGQSEIAAILDQIDQWEASASGNHVTVVLALIIDQDPINPNVTTFNKNVKTMAEARTGDDIIIVNQQGALVYPNDMSDAVHPRDSGYTKMANVWFNALKSVLDKCGS
jgi:hypothetical protein